MPPDEFRQLLIRCGWSARRVAIWCGVHPGTGGHWRTGQQPVPPRVATWLRGSAALLATNPPPKPPIGAGIRGKAGCGGAPQPGISPLA